MSDPSSALVLAGQPVRRLAAADIPSCMALAADRNWLPEENLWRLLAKVSEMYGIDDPVGGLAGIAVLTRYGAGLASVGMVVVVSRYGRMGLGTRLMRHVLRQAEGAVVQLTATSHGRGLYARLGFREVDTSGMYAGRLTCGLRGTVPRSHGSGDRWRVAVRGAEPADLRAITELDRPVFGADRASVLAELFIFGEAMLVAERPAVESGPRLAGFAASWRKDDMLVIGPVVAADLDIAAALITRLAAGSESPVRLDVLGGHAGLAQWATARGLVRRGQTAFMAYGGSLPGDRNRLFAPVSVAIG
jgi:ribosomal protein S18 acetylase RimI-like enzyme